MSQVVSITSQGQVTIPKSQRIHLNIGKNAKAVIERKGNQLVITPISNFFSLAGSIEPKEKTELDFKKMRQAFIKHLATSASK